MERKYRLGIDIDGTVTDPTTFVPYLNKAFNKALTYEQITQYHLPPLYGISDEEFFNWFKHHEGPIYKDALLAQGAKEALHYFAQQKHELIYISARPQAHHALTMDWFKQHQLPYHAVDLLGSHNKIAKAKEHRVHLFYEDKMDNANDLAEELSIPVLLFDTPYNQGVLHSNVYRVKHWHEALSLTNNLLKENEK